MNDSSFIPMLEALVNARATEFVEENPDDLSVYGLDKPAYELIFSTEATGEVKLQMGFERREDYTIYAKFDGEDEVFAIDTNTFTFLDKPLKEIVNIFAYIVNIQDVEKIDLTMDGKTTHMELDVYLDEEGNMDGQGQVLRKRHRCQRQGRKRQAAVQEILPGADRRLHRRIDLEGDPAGKQADITIEYRSETGKMKVEYIPKDEHSTTWLGTANMPACW